MSLDLHGALSILGISIILVESAVAFTIVKYLGAAYLCWIGIKALIAASKTVNNTDLPAPTKKARTIRAALVEGFLTNALNPKVSMFYLAAFPQFINVGETSTESAFLLVFLHSMVNAIWFGAMVLFFSSLTTLSRSGKFQRCLKAITGFVFIGFGIKLANFKVSL